MYTKDRHNIDLGFTHFPLVNRVDNKALSCLSEYWAENWIESGIPIATKPAIIAYVWPIME
ncbi:hypothetical protein H5186_21635 [Pseudoalteromonas sp. SG41-2]|jgi:hypothetical protein|uniref:hypothetical protein n=1 Tax=Pseudoalteromonas sp. SG41-2 TaxID=2760978 RepID=UPI001603B51D|nr:hypothetical protein [Pseudoalteromonas sp. SG41-2]MBB1482027.1 hypothetical protein [Pseudoalteromonas sp. SG41-2]